MFQINTNVTTRSVTLSVNPQEKEVFNQLFAELQGLEGEKTYFKDLILVALQRAISSTPANEVQELRDLVAKLSLDLENATQSTSVCTPEEYQSKLDRIEALEMQVGSLENQVRHSENLEIEVESIDEIINSYRENNVAINLSNDERQVLSMIIENRKKKGKEPVCENYSDLVKGLAFNRGSLYNDHMEFYTGL